MRIRKGRGRPQSATVGFTTYFHHCGHGERDIINVLLVWILGVKCLAEIDAVISAQTAQQAMVKVWIVSARRRFPEAAKLWLIMSGLDESQRERMWHTARVLFKSQLEDIELG